MAHCAPQSWKNPDRLSRCVLLINISRGAAHIVPHPQQQQLLRLKSCPASNYDCIPVKSLGGRGACHGFYCCCCCCFYPLPRLYPLYEIHPSPSRIEILTHILLDSGVDGDRSVSVLHLLQMLQQQQQQLDVAASAPLSPVGASVWYARRSGMQGVAGGMLLEEKTERFLVPIVSS